VKDQNRQHQLDAGRGQQDNNDNNNNNVIWRKGCLTAIYYQQPSPDLIYPVETPAKCLVQKPTSSHSSARDPIGDYINKDGGHGEDTHALR
jgi:hypothetical protein